MHALREYLLVIAYRTDRRQKSVVYVHCHSCPLTWQPAHQKV